MKRRRKLSIVLIGFGVVFFCFLLQRVSLQATIAEKEPEVIIPSFEVVQEGALENYYDRNWEACYVSEWCRNSVEFEVNPSITEALQQIEYQRADYRYQEESDTWEWSEYSDYQSMDQALKLDLDNIPSGVISIRFQGIYEGKAWESLEYIIRIDQSEPEITLRSDQNLDIWNKEAIDVTVVLEEEPISSGLCNIRILLDEELMVSENYEQDKGPKKWEKELSIGKESSTSEGLKLFIQVTDQAGNSKEFSQYLKIDQTAPEVTVAGVAPESYSNQTVYIAVGIKEQIAEGTMVRIRGEKTDSEDHKEKIAEEWTVEKAHLDKVLSYSEEGHYVMYASATDQAGNQSEIHRIAFTIDRTAPEIKIKGVEDGSYYNDSVTAAISIKETFSDVDAVTACIKVDREWSKKQEISYYDEWKKQDNLRVCELSFLQDGIYRIEVYAEDQAGNKSGPIRLSFTIDREPPLLIIKGAEDHQVSAQGFQLTYEIEDAVCLSENMVVKVVKKDLYGNQIDYETGIAKGEKQKAEQTEQYREEGIYQITLMAEDQAGNSAYLEKWIIVDRTSPMIRYINKLDGSYLQSFSMAEETKDFIQDLTIPSYRMYLNGENYGGKTVIEKEGNYVLRVEAVDEAGNFAQAQASFVIDRSPPKVLFDEINEEGIYKIPMELTIQLLNKEDFVDSIYINGNQKEVKSGADTYQFSFSEEGDYVIEVNASDRAGNKTKEQLELHCYKRPMIHVVPQRIKKTVEHIWRPGILVFAGLLCTAIIFIRKKCLK